MAGKNIRKIFNLYNSFNMREKYIAKNNDKDKIKEKDRKI